MEDVFLPIVICAMLFVGLPWLIFHYVTQWKKNGGLSQEDEKALDEMYETARRLDDRLATIERIIAADHPDYRQGRAQEREMLERPAPAYRPEREREFDRDLDRDREPARRTY